jgi:hypothetical protein
MRSKSVPEEPANDEEPRVKRRLDNVQGSISTTEGQDFTYIQ